MTDKEKKIHCAEVKAYYKKYPWKRTLGGIRYRCNTPTHKYYKRGIKNFLTEADLGNIALCCRGKRHTANGYVWKYGIWEQGGKPIPTPQFIIEKMKNDKDAEILRLRKTISDLQSEVETLRKKLRLSEKEIWDKICDYL